MILLLDGTLGKLVLSINFCQNQKLINLREQHVRDQDVADALRYKVNDFLQSCRVSYLKLTKIAYGCGPGKISGRNATCAFAQGVSAGLGIPLVSFNASQAISETALSQRLISKNDKHFVATPISSHSYALVDCTSNSFSYESKDYSSFKLDTSTTIIQDCHSSLKVKASRTVYTKLHLIKTFYEQV